MKAMILAAGLGTRLRPLTNDRPKALVEVAGRTLLEITIARLRTFGVTEIIVNVHHFAQLVVDYLKAHNDFGVRVEISREDDLLLGTGGGLKKASWFFEQSAPDQPFLLHNVDVVSSIDLGKMLDAHRHSRALATLAVKERNSSRQLLFDDQGRLCGRRNRKGAADEITPSAATLHPLAFCGIHVISPLLLPLITEDGAFSIIDSYLRLAFSGRRLQAFDAQGCYWRDLGKPEDLQQAGHDIAVHLLRA